MTWMQRAHSYWFCIAQKRAERGETGPGSVQQVLAGDGALDFEVQARLNTYLLNAGNKTGVPLSATNTKSGVLQ